MPDDGFTELAGSRVALRRDAPYPREAGERFIREIARDHPDTAGEWFQFAVGLRATGQLIGDCAAMPRPP